MWSGLVSYLIITTDRLLNRKYGWDLVSPRPLLGVSQYFVRMASLKDLVHLKKGLA